MIKVIDITDDGEYILGEDECPFGFPCPRLCGSGGNSEALEDAWREKENMKNG